MSVVAQSWRGLALLLVVSGRVSADVPPAYAVAARTHGVPADLLYSIACAESGRALGDGRVLPWPWALNIAGDSFFFTTRAEMRAALVRALRAGQSVDIGPGQVSWRWHAKRFASLDAALDPFRNLDVAAAILREQHDACACNDWWIAVERYHAPAEKEGAKARRLRYRQRVEQCWERVFES